VHLLPGLAVLAQNVTAKVLQAVKRQVDQPVDD